MSHPDLLATFRQLKTRAPLDGVAHRIYVAGCSGEPRALYEALAASPEDAADTVFLGIWIPGVNKLDWASLHPSARAETIFLSPDLRASFEARETLFRPLTYLQAVDWLMTTPLDGVVAVTAPGSDDGTLSLGVSPDFTGEVIRRSDVPAIALTTPHMPVAKHGHGVPTGRFHSVCETDSAILTLPPADLNPRFAELARHVAGLIETGATLQFGLGNVQAAVLDALKDHRGLHVHSGMISDPILPLLASGAVEKVTTGVALGSAALYEQTARDPRVTFSTVPETHQLDVLERLPRFTAINSAMEVDLFGQANCEFIGAQQVSGCGGLTDFLRGAMRSPGGRGIVATLSTAKGGTVSRIVPRLAPNAVSIPRGDMHTVVTEHGVAEVLQTDIDARADRLIAIADPAHRDRLANEWEKMRSAM